MYLKFGSEDLTPEILTRLESFSLDPKTSKEPLDHLVDWVVAQTCKDMTIIINNSKVYLCDFETKRVDRIPFYAKTYADYFRAFFQ